MKRTEVEDMEVARVAKASSCQSCYDCGPLLGDVFRYGAQQETVVTCYGNKPNMRVESGRRSCKNWELRSKQVSKMRP